MKSIGRRLDALEARTAPASSEWTMTLAGWRTWHETGELPDTPAADRWHEEVQARHQQCAETIAMFEEDSIEQQGDTDNDHNYPTRNRSNHYHFRLLPTQ